MPDPLLGWLARISQALDTAHVEHAIAGGLAVAAWAQPRATVDIDIVVAGEADDIAHARAACETLGFLRTKSRPIKFKRISMMRMLIPPESDPEPIAVDLLLVPASLERKLLARRVDLSLSGARLPFVSAEDAILLKLLRFSDQDRVDIRAIASGRSLDRRYLRAQAKTLRVLTRLSAVALR